MSLPWRRARRALSAGLSRYVLPTPCFACARLLGPDQHLGACPECWSSLRPLGAPTCATCAAPVADGDRRAAEARCGRCVTWSPPVDAACAAVAYGRTARRFLLRAKFGGRRELIEPLASQLALRVGCWPWDPRDAAVVPVPSHPWTRLRRGFDPAEEFARRLAAALDLPAPTRALRRRWTSRSAVKRLGAGARRDAAASAFVCVARRLDGAARVLLVDDVWTTGASVTACARALRAAGVAEVGAAVWARTPAPGGALRHRSV